MDDKQQVVVDEVVVLSKFDGDPLPQNEVERITIKNGKVVNVEQISNGKVISTGSWPPGPPVRGGGN